VIAFLGGSREVSIFLNFGSWLPQVEPGHTRDRHSRITQTNLTTKVPNRLGLTDKVWVPVCKLGDIIR
jgi:hypothetical protein